MLNVFQYQFIENAFLAGSLIAITASVVGYFLLVRGLSFAGHALSHIGFAGAAGAVLFGIDPLFGLLLFTILAALGIGVLGRDFRERDITIGIILTLMLGLGVLFLSVYSGYAEAAYSILFGTIVGINHLDVFITLLLSISVLSLIVLMFRPLLFASIDPEVALSRGVPVRFLSVIFLVIVAIAVSISVYVVGVLLIFTLLIGPAASAMRISNTPSSAITLSVILSLIYVWVSIFISALTNLPVSFLIAAFSFVFYLIVRLMPV